ncbi:MAG: hypothetical protein FWE33_05780 [Defluviitaleaceae bacterium]|nr:hypothetical protein [Defluviitaleaceae bacterium]
MDDQIKNFLQYIFEIVEGIERANSVDHAECSVCRSTYADFKKSGKMGCANCYKAFGEQIAQALKNIHGNNVHTGKIPCGKEGKFADVVARRELEENRILLQKAIETESYEDAARYRDIVKALVDEIGENA